MILKQISILNYKNISNASISLSSKFNCFVGYNGQGKTNLLDAVYFLAFCKSSTTNVDSQVILHGADFMMLNGLFQADDGHDEKIYCGFKSGYRKVFKRGDKEYPKLSEHIGKIKIVMVSPNDINLVTDGSELRRKFIDQIISQYDSEYLIQLIRYQKALQQRGILLRMNTEPEETLISIYENEMAESGAVICQKRAEFIKEFIPIFNKVYKQLSDNNEEVSLQYISQGLEGDLLSKILASRQRDLIVGHSLCGIHRDDLEMMLNGYFIRKEGSQGQIKTFTISLKLAQFEFFKGKTNGQLPILMLDDIFDKLDTHRVEKIIKTVSSDSFGQILITDTKRDFLEKIQQCTGSDFYFFNVEGGIIHEAH